MRNIQKEIDPLAPTTSQITDHSVTCFSFLLSIDSSRLTPDHGETSSNSEDLSGEAPLSTKSTPSMKVSIFILFAGLALSSAFSPVHRTTAALNGQASALFLSSRTKVGETAESIDNKELDESTAELQSTVGFSYVEFAQNYPFVSPTDDLKSSHTSSLLTSPFRL